MKIVAKKTNISDASVSRWSLDDAYRGPGHLIRRLQQIAVAIFMDEFRELEITPVQYVALVAVRDRPGLEQRALGDLIAIDRSSAGRVFQFLEERGWIGRVTPKENRRTKQLYVTPLGEKLSDKCAPLIRRAEQRILRMLPPEDQRQFMSLLVKLVDVNNTLSRAPLKIRPSKQGRVALPKTKDLTGAAKRGRAKGRLL